MMMPLSVDGLRYWTCMMSRIKAKTASSEGWKKRVKPILLWRRMTPIRKYIADDNASTPNTCENR